MPKVSVVVPVFNSERYLPECLDSVLSQSLRDIEVVCVDDGSTDASPAIATEYARGDDRITVLSQENRGPGAARNVGVASAHGDYLCFLDSDDRLQLSALEELWSRASSDDLDILYFDATPFCEDGDLAEQFARFESYYRRSREYPGVFTGRQMMAAMCEHRDYRPAACFQFLNSGYYRSSGLSFPEDIIHEDNLFTFFAAQKAERTAYVPATYYQRRVRSESIMTTERGEVNFTGFLTSYVEMLRYVVGEELDERTANASAQLCTEMFQQALNVYCAMPREARVAITPTDSTAEALVAMSLLTRHGGDRLKLRKSEKALRAAEQKLEQIRNSRAYRLASSLRRLPGIGK